MRDTNTFCFIILYLFINVFFLWFLSFMLEKALSVNATCPIDLTFWQTIFVLILFVLLSLYFVSLQTIHCLALIVLLSFRLGFMTFCVSEFWVKIVFPSLLVFCVLEKATKIFISGLWSFCTFFLFWFFFRLVGAIRNFTVTRSKTMINKFLWLRLKMLAFDIRLVLEGGEMPRNSG